MGSKGKVDWRGTTGAPKPAEKPDSDLEFRTYSVPETARALGIGRSKAYEMVQDGTLPVIRFGKLIRVTDRALRKLVGVEK
jgi:excisionase family DNA binding protein